MLYFAYGSNMSFERLFERCSSCQNLGVAILDNYRLVFMTNNRGKIVANIEPFKGERVVGILYHLTQADLKKLDRYEGRPYVYKRVQMDVTLENGRQIETFTYAMEKYYSVYREADELGKTPQPTEQFYRRRYGKPRKDYLNHILKGFEENLIDTQPLVTAIEVSKALSKQTQLTR
jgi:gamma-glutamylcyclotransferase (GGCT)/AIG2-like uncharacterized protein YtfP